MPLKSAAVNVKTAAPAKRDEIPSIVLDGNLCTRFNEAKKNLKEAEQIIKEIEPELHAQGLREFFAVAVENPTHAPTSVKLVDDEGSITRLTVQDRYKQADATVADAAFTSLEADINQYAHETVKAAFDSNVFIDKDGNFSRTIFNAFQKAIDDCARKLKVASPLTGKTVVAPKPDFHANRYSEFPTVEAQLTIQSALPAVVALSPVVA